MYAGVLHTFACILSTYTVQPSKQEQPSKKAASRIDGSILRREGGGATGLPAATHRKLPGLSLPDSLQCHAENVGQWLSESVVDSLTRLGPAEQGSASAEENAVVRVRLCTVHLAAHLQECCCLTDICPACRDGS